MLEYEARADRHAACSAAAGPGIVDGRDARWTAVPVDDLPRAGAAARLLHGFVDLGEPGHADRMATRDEATVTADRHAPTDAGRATVEQHRFVTGRTQAERGVGEHFFRRHRIVDLQQFEILRADAGLRVDPRKHGRRGIHGGQTAAFGRCGR